MNKQYYWKILTNDGRLVEPVSIISRLYINDGPFDSVEEAENELNGYFSKYQESGYISKIELVLITVYNNMGY